MYKIGIVGDKDSVLGFMAVGFDVYPVSDYQEAAKKIDKMAGEGYGVIFITEQIAEGLRETLDKYKDSLVPAIIPIPGTQGSLGLGLKNIRKSIERAVGADILSMGE